jgi:hypothetical protein
VQQFLQQLVVLLFLPARREPRVNHHLIYNIHTDDHSQASAPIGQAFAAGH